MASIIVVVQEEFWKLYTHTHTHSHPTFVPATGQAPLITVVEYTSTHQHLSLLLLGQKARLHFTASAVARCGQVLHLGKGVQMIRAISSLGSLMGYPFSMHSLCSLHTELNRAGPKDPEESTIRWTVSGSLANECCPLSRLDYEATKQDIIQTGVYGSSCYPSQYRHIT